ncbi:261_t:CDS:2 [Racocetra persica]|uniref:261_t:CDS:1 n=1 Tax=Racocetra persica TaxID=160502 RepID=A0ACA9P2X4_9GLOM|nr:261_t:CDS:2 [Racocetra persica]
MMVHSVLTQLKDVAATIAILNGVIVVIHLWTNNLLDKLDEYGIKTTFSVNGHNDDAYLYTNHNFAIFRSLNRPSHMVSPYLTGVSADEANYQMEFLNEAFKKILGVTLKYFRSSYGDGVNNANVRSAMLANGMDELISQAIDNGYWFDTVAGCNGDWDSSNWYNIDTGYFGTRDELGILNRLNFAI